VSTPFQIYTTQCSKLIGKRIKKYGLNMLGSWITFPSINVGSSNLSTVSADDQVKAYIKKIMSQLKEWMQGGKISKLVVVITDKETGEHVERWQFDVCIQHSNLSYPGRWLIAFC
jgi:inorganic pyrophosphatase/exopolyphosphatase